NGTFQQTRPRAVIEVGPFTDIGTNPSAPYSQFFLRVPYSNTGDVAKNVHLFGHAYVGNPDQKLAEKEIVPEFDRAWAEHIRISPPIKVFTRDNNETYSDFTSGFSNQEMRDVQSGQKAMYELFRMRYTDQTGTWDVDRCNVVISVVINGRGTAVQCSFFNGGPLRAR
ncbi:MAG: hypothetical protein WB950_14150, partial [Acidobacteriaceae bacterium]